jgi:hypothetical protein
VQHHKRPGLTQRFCGCCANALRTARYQNRLSSQVNHALPRDAFIYSGSLALPPAKKLAEPAFAEKDSY